MMIDYISLQENVTKVSFNIWKRPFATRGHRPEYWINGRLEPLKLICSACKDLKDFPGASIADITTFFWGGGKKRS